MTFPPLLCVLSAGLCCGRGFAASHRLGRRPALPVLGHAAVSAVLVLLSVWLGGTELGMLRVPAALPPHPLVGATSAPRQGVPTA